MGISERREREKRHRIHNIIDAAEKVFFAKGFAHSSMDEIAMQAELSKGTIYFYFKNKDDLYLAIVLRGLEIMYRSFDAVLAGSGSGLEKTVKLGECYWAFFRSYPHYFQAIMNFVYRFVKFDETAPYASKCIEEAERGHRNIVRVIQDGIADGSIRSDLNPEIIGIVISRNADGLMQFIAGRQNFTLKVDPEKLFQCAMELAIQSIRR